jgi:hypothetical protein
LHKVEDKELRDPGQSKSMHPSATSCVLSTASVYGLFVFWLVPLHRPQNLLLPALNPPPDAGGPPLIVPRTLHEEEKQC